ncbi:MAG: DUF945 domain-containing protein [Firmicutes bacterium]|nr:DUF945 domain-containing protein [Bacillota bacterium]
MYGTEGWSNPVTLGDVRERVRRGQTYKWDAPARWADLSFQPGRKGVQMAVRGIDRTLSMTPQAFADVCGRLGVPVTYAAGLHPAMAVELMRYEYVRRRLAHSDRGLLLRCYGNLVRGLVSDRYVPLDDAAVLEAVCKELAGVCASVHHYYLGPAITELRILLLDYQVELKATRPGDIVQLGLYLRNSEVGQSSLTIHGFALRLLCTNGMVVAEGTEFRAWRHIAVRPEKALTELRRAVRRMLQRLTGMGKLLQAATRSRPIHGSYHALESLARAHGFPAHLTYRILQAYRSDPYDSLFGVVNALTAVARWSRARTRTRLEVLAGDIIRQPWLYGLETT